jgi:hypothetical protein
MKRLFTTALVFGLLIGGARADEATKQKLLDPRYAEATPKFTLKIAADVRSAQAGPTWPAYPAAPVGKPAAVRWPYWLAAIGLALAVIGFGGARRTKRKTGRSGE